MCIFWLSNLNKEFIWSHSHSRSSSHGHGYVRAHRFVRKASPPKIAVVVRGRSHSRISRSINKKNLRVPRSASRSASRHRSRSDRRMRKGHSKDDSSSSDYKYWLGLRPGKWMDKKGSYGHVLGKRSFSAGHYGKKKVVIVKNDPIFKEKKVIDFGRH